MGKRVRALLFTAVTSGVVLLFALLEWFVEKVIADHSRVAGTTIEIAIVLAATLAFRPIHQRVEGAMEAAFSKRRRHALEAIARLRHEISSYKDVSQLLRRVTDAVDHYMEADGCAIYVRHDIYHAQASSFDDKPEPVDVDDPLAIRLRSASGPARPRALHSNAPGSVAFAMTVAGELIGFLTVEKRGEYELEEAQALAALAESAGVALAVLDPYVRVQGVDVPNNLPMGLPPLIGRDRDLGEIKALLEQSRLVTVVGSGGVGKTRTAVHIASEMVQNNDGVWLVDLAPLTDPALVPSTIADVFGIADEGDARSLTDRLATALKVKRLLLVLDNCDHLLGATSAVAVRLMHACANVQILATSREPLGVPGEEVYRLPSLPVPPSGETLTADSAMRYASVALFVARARSAQRSFALSDSNATIVGEIVRRLDGIALAIELAAPRLKVLSVEQIAQRLDERFKLLASGSRGDAHHQTLRAMIEWSYDFLSADEQRLLRVTSIFRGSWALEYIEAVSETAPDHETEILDLIASLVDKSLIVTQEETGQQWYRLLESTREYAFERLCEAGEYAAIAARHCAYFARSAERAAQSYWVLDSDLWTAQVRLDLENYRTALAWGCEPGGDAIAAASIVGNLRPFWYNTARGEGRALIARAASCVPGEAPPAIRGRLALTEAFLENSARAIAPAAEAARLLDGVDELGRIEALMMQATALGRAGEIDAAIALCHQLPAPARAAGCPSFTGWVLTLVAYWLGAAGEKTHARTLFDEAAEILRVCNDRWQLARLQVNRAEFLFAEGDVTAALAGVREAQSVFRERNSDSGLCIATLNETAYLIELERIDEARESARQGLEIALRSGMSVATAVTHLACIAAHDADLERAAKLLGYADHALQSVGSAREPTDQRVYECAMDRVRSGLRPEELEALMADGAVMGRDVAATEALADPPSALLQY